MISEELSDASVEQASGVDKGAHCARLSADLSQF